MASEHIEELKKKLHKKDVDLGERLEKSDLTPHERGGRTYWSDGYNKEEIIAEALKPKVKSRKGLYITLSILFVVLVVAGGIFYLVNSGYNFGVSIFGSSISSKKIDIEINGPSTIKAGERGKWYIFVTNNNKVGIDLADIIIDYPEDTITLEGKTISRDRIPIGAIAPGERAQKEISVYLLGESNNKQEIGIVLEYRMEKSNAIFAKETKHTVMLTGSPVGVTVNLPETLESGQEMVIDIEYVSNSDTVLGDVYLNVEYPPGFKYIESDFEPVKGNNLWLVGDLMPQEKRSLMIRGVLEGQDMTEMAFGAYVGTLKEGNNMHLFSKASNTVLLKKPFLNLRFSVNDKNVDYVPSDKSVAIVVSFKNNLLVEIKNANIEVKLGGESVDLGTLSVAKGFYRGYDDTIVWNASSLPELLTVSPGEEISARFTFYLKRPIPVATLSDKNFTLSFNMKIFGIKTGDDGQDVVVTSETSRELKVESSTDINTDLAYGSGPFANSGPLPPKVGQETTYTVTWSLLNLYNNLEDAVVTSSLPPYVRWLGIVAPQEEDLFYHPGTGSLTWRVGGLSSGTGILLPEREVSFQIAFLPSINHVDKSPMLVGNVFFEGKDSFTSTILKNYPTKILSTKSISEAIGVLKIGKVVE